MSYKIKNKKLDLLSAYNRNDEPSQMSKTLKLLIAPVSLVTVFAIVFAFITVMNLNKKSELNSIKEDIEVTQLKIDSTDKSPYDELKTMETAFSAIQSLDASLVSLPEITKTKIAYVQKNLLAGVLLKSLTFDQATNMLDISLSSENVQNIEKYVSRLRTNTEYKNVEYSGYQQTTSTNTTPTDMLGPDGKPIQNVTSSVAYSFQVKITLNGKAGE